MLYIDRNSLIFVSNFYFEKNVYDYDTENASSYSGLCRHSLPIYNPVPMKKVIFTALAIVVCMWASAQIVIDTSATASGIANRLVGNGVTVTNAVLNCPSGASALFRGGNASSIGIPDGIFLANGRTVLITEPHDTLDNTMYNLPGDADLGNLLYNLGVLDTFTFDACVLEFDVRPLGDTLSFKYVFSSEEYDSFTCSPFTDVFGFFITGPNPAGGTYNKANIALIPGTTLPVAINTVNGGAATGNNYDGDCISLAYSQYFRIDPSICYGGSTVPLNAAVAVSPCQTYHLKLAVADVGDSVLDSGVFIQGGSLNSNGLPEIKDVKIDHQLPYAVRGCAGARVYFLQPHPTALPYTLHMQIRGTAVNGVDYTTLPDSVVFAPHDSIATLYIDPLVYAGAQSNRTVIIYLIANVCGNRPYDSVTIIIQDSIHLDIAAPATVCSGSTIQLQATGVPSCIWHPGTGLSDSTITDPMVTIDSSVTYIASYTTGTCFASDTVVILTSGTTRYHADTAVICAGAGYPFGGQTLTTAGIYTETLSAPGGCDSIITLTLQIDTPASLTFSRQICIGDSMLFAGHYYHTTGIYRDTVVTGSGCYDITTLALSVVSFLSTPIAVTLCPGAAVPFAGQIITTPGVYRDTLQSAGGCDSIVTLTVDTAPIVYHSVGAVLCAGRTLHFGTYVIATAGTYIDTFTSGRGCDSIVTLTVTGASGTAASLSQSICEGRIFHYHDLNISAAGTYLDTLVNAAGCDSIVTLNISMLSTPVDSFSAIVCTGGAYTFGGRQLYTSGIYRDTTAASNGCDSISIVHLDISPSPEANFVLLPPGPIMEIGPVFVTDQSLRADSTFWILDDHSISLTSGGMLPIGNAGQYCIHLIASTSAGCRDTFTDCITVINTDLFLPNAFSPNGDGINDFIELYGSYAGIRYLSITIFDRWGEKVFSSNDLNFRWDGTYRGVLLEPNIFVYTLDVIFLTGRSVNSKGSITLIR